MRQREQEAVFTAADPAELWNTSCCIRQNGQPSLGLPKPEIRPWSSRCRQSADGNLVSDRSTICFGLLQNADNRAISDMGRANFHYQYTARFQCHRVWADSTGFMPQGVLRRHRIYLSVHLVANLDGISASGDPQ